MSSAQLPVTQPRDRWTRPNCANPNWYWFAVSVKKKEYNCWEGLPHHPDWRLGNPVHHLIWNISHTHSYYLLTVPPLLRVRIRSAKWQFCRLAFKVWISVVDLYSSHISKLRTFDLFQPTRSLRYLSGCHSASCCKLQPGGRGTRALKCANPLTEFIRLGCFRKKKKNSRV